MEVFWHLVSNNIFSLLYSCRDHQWQPGGEKKMTGGTNFQAPGPTTGMYPQPMIAGQMVCVINNLSRHVSKYQNPVTR